LLLADAAIDAMMPPLFHAAIFAAAADAIIFADAIFRFYAISLSLTPPLCILPLRIFYFR